VLIESSGIGGVMSAVLGVASGGTLLIAVTVADRSNGLREVQCTGKVCRLTRVDWHVNESIRAAMAYFDADLVWDRDVGGVGFWGDGGLGG
jgi:hypothetical protein